MAGGNKRQLRILALTSLYPTPSQPHFAAYNRQQFAALSKTCDLRIICPVPWPLVARDALHGRFRSRVHKNEDGLEVVTPTFVFPPRVLSHRYGEFFEQSVRRVVDATLTEFQPDAILSSWAHPDGWAAVRIGRAAGLPVLVKIVGTDVRLLATGLRRPRIVEALVGADSVVAVSEELASRAIDLGAPPSRVHVVPEGIDVDRFSPGDRGQARRRLMLPATERMILFVGHLLDSKGAVDLVKACAVLQDRGVEFSCRFVGHGRHEAAVQAAIHASNLSSRVFLHGVRPHQQLPDWYRASDVVALPSYSEGIPNVLREALASGRPFVASDVGGIPEIADASYSRLVQAGDITAMAGALSELLEHPPVVDPVIVGRVNVSWEQSAALLRTHAEDAIAARSHSTFSTDAHLASV